ncbi:MAG: hypothetical protein DDG60_06495 [Anaerolineae bacterium]|nr:MAG: hypothetical protein DDG60_06495 [Anaerolineae bacterium]
MVTDPLQQAQQRTLRYWYVDGTFELSIGGMCLLLAAYFYAEILLADSWLSNIMFVFFLLIMIGGGFLINRLVMMLKEHVTFPRTGYVSFAHPTGARQWKRMLLLSAFSAFLAALIVFLILNSQAGFDWTTTVTGLIFSAVLVFLAWRFRLLRFLAYAVLSVGLGVVLGFANWPHNFGLVLYYGALGLSMLLAGAVILGNYLRQNPAPAEASHDE